MLTHVPTAPAPERSLVEHLAGAGIDVARDPNTEVVFYEMPIDYRRHFHGYSLEDVLRDRLLEEGDRFCSREWAEYKQHLWQVEMLLRAAGVPNQTVHDVLGDLDERAVALYTCGQADLLDLGIAVGRGLAEDQPFVVNLPGGDVCHTCHGGGGQHDGPVTRGRIDGDAPCPACGGSGRSETDPLKLIYLGSIGEKIYPDRKTEPANTEATAA